MMEGYRRSNGGFGVRNHVLCASTVACANGVVHQVERAFPEVICLEHDKGCIELEDDREMTRKMLMGLARNPNVGAVVFVGLGCEDTQAKSLQEELIELKPTAQVTIQEEGGTTGALQKCSHLVSAFIKETQKAQREPFTLDSLVVAAKCGGTDWTSGIASNPTVGLYCDRMVRAGGTFLIGESMGWFGAEQDFFRRIKYPELKQKILDLMLRKYETAQRRGVRIEKANPSPGNIKGGVSTLVEKALGSSRKSGDSLIQGLLGVGEQPCHPGLWLIDTPGIDPASVAVMAAAGAQLIIFTTGRGTPTGSPICPVIKVCASPSGVASLPQNVDIDLTDIVTRGASLEDGANRLEFLVQAVVNGQKTRSEELGHREFIMPTVDMM